MPVRAIPITNDSDWTVNINFLEQIDKEIRKNEGKDYMVDLEDIDCVIRVLLDNGFTIGSFAGSAYLKESKGELWRCG